MRTFYYCDRGKEIESYLRQVFSAAVYSAATVYAFMLVVGEAAFDVIFAHAEVQVLPAGAIALATASMNACLSPYFVFLRNSLRLRELVYWQTLIVAGTVVLQCVLVVGFDWGLCGVLWSALAPVALTAALLLAGIGKPFERRWAPLESRRQQCRAGQSRDVREA